jgi:hypothetical protein
MIVTDIVLNPPPLIGHDHGCRQLPGTGPSDGRKRMRPAGLAELM